MDTTTLTLTDIDQGLGEALAHLALQAPGCRFAASDRPHPDIDRHLIMIKAKPSWREAWSWALERMAAFVEAVPEPAGHDECGMSFRGADAVLVNALRRAVIGAVPTQALTKFTVIENTSSVCDDILIRRLSQLPLATTTATDAVVQLTLCASLPTLEEQQAIHWRLHGALCTWRGTGNGRRRRWRLRASRIVTHHEASMLGGKVGGLPDDDASVPLLVLRPGERVHLTASSSRGTGDVHPRYTAVTGVRFEVENGVTVLGFSSIGQLPCSRILAHAKAHLLSVLESIASGARCEEQQAPHTV